VSIFPSTTVSDRRIPIQTIRIGILTSQQNLQRSNTIQIIAQTDLNKYCADNKLPFKFNIQVKSILSDDSNLMREIAAFHRTGYDLIIGPDTSGQCQTILKYANKNDMLLISPTSTSTSLAIPRDNLYRMWPPDSNQAKALVKAWLDKGIKAVYIVYRDDLYGQGLFKAIQPLCQANGIKIVGSSPSPIGQSDFTGLLADADSKLGNTALPLCSISFDAILYSSETRVILSQLSQGSYPVLDKIVWFGCDGNADNSLCNSVGETACKVQLICPIFAIDWNSPENIVLIQKWQALVGNIDCNLADRARYDACMMMGLASIRKCNSNNIMAVKRSLVSLASTYIGTTGAVRFDANGDRIGSNYEFWGFYKDAVGYHFWHFGKYFANPESTVWYNPPFP
jgi:branched-chain amino acid transport system substrate-binding protein